MFNRAISTLMLVVVSTLGSAALAADRAIDGVVDVKKDDAGEVQSVAIVTNGGDRYTVTMDDNGKKMAKEFPDKKVHVSGDVKEDDDKKSITVATYAEKAD